MEGHKYSQYCFPDRNSSCKKSSISNSIYITLYIFFALISAVTVFLNLLVIFTISHFKQLHTPTNLLILSLAVSDFLVGLIAIPAITAAIMEACWFLQGYLCALLLYISYLCTSSSIGNLVLISIDRHVAVCDPLMYNSKLTKTRTQCAIYFSWCCCIMVSIVTFSLNVKIPSRCFQECYVIRGDIWVTLIGFVITIGIPCSIILTLYLKIFVVARSQARKVFLKGIVRANKSEKKAAKTLGIVVFNYIICWIPMYISRLFFHVESGNLFSSFICFFPLVNSLINPIIYAFLYPWFKETVKRFLTLNVRSL